MFEPPDLERLLPDQARERGDARFVLRDRVGPDMLVVKLAELVLIDPAADQMPTDVEPFAQSQQRLAVGTGFDDQAPCVCGAVLS